MNSGFDNFVSLNKVEEPGRTDRIVVDILHAFEATDWEEDDENLVLIVSVKPQFVLTFSNQTP